MRDKEKQIESGSVVEQHIGLEDCDDYKIEDDIPIPPVHCTTKAERRNAMLVSMRVKQSLLLKEFQNSDQASHLRKTLKRKAPKAQFTFRTVKGGVRVWRTK